MCVQGLMQVEHKQRSYLRLLLLAPVLHIKWQICKFIIQRERVFMPVVAFNKFPSNFWVDLVVGSRTPNLNVRCNKELELVNFQTSGPHAHAVVRNDTMIN